MSSVDWLQWQRHWIQVTPTSGSHRGWHCVRTPPTGSEGLQVKYVLQGFELTIHIYFLELKLWMRSRPITYRPNRNSSWSQSPLTIACVWCDPPGNRRWRHHPFAPDVAHCQWIRPLRNWISELRWGTLEWPWARRKGPTYCRSGATSKTRRESIQV